MVAKANARSVVRSETQVTPIFNNSELVGTLLAGALVPRNNRPGTGWCNTQNLTIIDLSVFICLDKSFKIAASTHASIVIKRKIGFNFSSYNKQPVLWFACGQSRSSHSVAVVPILKES